MKVTPRKIRHCEQHKMPNKKRKQSVLREIAVEEEENADNNEFNKLSADVITSVLIRCPVNALSMLRCTSKSWNDFITSPSFVHSHLEQSKEDAQVLFVEPTYSKAPQSIKCMLQFVSVDMEGKGEINELYHVTLPVFPLNTAGSLVCAGLVCFSSVNCTYLFNPVMRQLRKLPKSSPTILHAPGRFGFGYCHSTKEYKVVRFFYMRNCHSNTERSQPRCEVFTLNGVCGISDGWKEIAETPPCHPCGLGLLVNECLYWLARTNISPPSRLVQVVSFDLENEKFVTISCPSSFETTLFPMSMMDLKGMLCLPDVDHFRRSSILDLWILKDKTSSLWVKDYSINLVDVGLKNVKPIFRTWNEEIIFIDSNKVVFYDLKGKCLRAEKSTPIIGSRFFQTTLLPLIGFGIYRKSLFSLGST